MVMAAFVDSSALAGRSPLRPTTQSPPLPVLTGPGKTAVSGRTEQAESQFRTFAFPLTRSLSPYLCPCLCALSILAQVSRSETVRLNTSLSGDESSVSTQK